MELTFIHFVEIGESDYQKVIGFDQRSRIAILTRLGTDYEVH